MFGSILTFGYMIVDWTRMFSSILTFGDMIVEAYVWLHIDLWLHDCGLDTYV